MLAITAQASLRDLRVHLAIRLKRPGPQLRGQLRDDLEAKIVARTGVRGPRVS